MNWAAAFIHILAWIPVAVVILMGGLPRGPLVQTWSHVLFILCALLAIWLIWRAPAVAAPFERLCVGLGILLQVGVTLFASFMLLLFFAASLYP